MNNKNALENKTDSQRASSIIQQMQAEKNSYLPDVGIRQ